MTTDTVVQQQLQQILARPNVFLDLTEIQRQPAFSAPRAASVFIGRLDRSTLTVFGADGGSTIITLEQIEKTNTTETGDPAPSSFVDLGTGLPNGVFFVAHELNPNGNRLPLFRVSRLVGQTRFAAIRIKFDTDENNDAAAQAIAAQIPGRGLLFRNTTEKPEPLLGFLNYEISEFQSFQILFVDLCANYARNKLSESKVELLQIKAAAQTQSALFILMVRQLRLKADAYYQLQSLRDFFNLLTYLRYLGLRSYMRSLNAEKQGFYRDVVDRVDILDRELAANTRFKSLKQLIELMDKKLSQMRRGTPLLGRLNIEGVRDKTNDQLAATVVSLIDTLIADNEAARAQLEEDTEDIRRLLTIVPPKVMGIPRIVKTIEERARPQINANVEYFWAVEKLKEQAATFSIVLGLGSLFFTFFCPPLSIALGILTAVVSVQDAAFKDALSDSDVSVDETFVTQAESREAWFMASLDVFFAVIDVVGGISELKDLVKSARGVNALEGVPRTVDELADLGRVAGDVEDAIDPRTLERIAGAADEAALGRATTEVDPTAARQGLQEAQTAPMDLSRSRTLDTPPASAQAAIDQGTAAVRQSIDRQFLSLIDQDYIRHFDESRRLGNNPLSWDEFARDWQQVRLRAEPTKTVPRSARDSFFDMLTQPNQSIGELLSDPSSLRQALVNQVKSGNLRTFADFPAGLSKVEKDFFRAFRKAVKKGRTTAQLDSLIQSRFLNRLDGFASRARLSGEAGREFGLFAMDVRKVTTWDDGGFQALSRLLGDARISPDELKAILNNRRYTQYKHTPLMNMELAIALDKIRDVEGVMTRVSASNPRLFDSLIAGNRGHAFEAVVVSRILEPAQQAGAKITVGRRWWLREIERLNTLEGTRYGNVLEADILIELADGRRILVDAKFFQKGLSITQALDTQLAKIATGIDEGLIHNGEYWVSHHFTRSRVGLTNFEAFQTAADLYSSGRIHLLFDVFEEGVPGNLLAASRFNEVSRGDTILIPPRADLPVPGVSGPSPIPSTMLTPAPDALIPVAARAADAIPDVFRQSDTIPAATQTSRNLDRSYVPIRPMATAGKLVLTVAPIVNHARTLVTTYLFFASPSDTDFGGTTSSELAVGPVTAALRQQIETALTTDGLPGKILVRSDSQRQYLTQLDPGVQGRMTQSESPNILYGLLLEGSAGIPAGSTFQGILYSAEGAKIDSFPDDDEDWLPLRPGLNVLPLPAMRVGDAIVHPFPRGSYQWGLRLRINNQIITHPDSIPMEVS